jgi:hypothetical protein
MLRLVGVAALTVAIGPGSAAAQNLIVTGGKPGTTATGQVNTEAATTATADAKGNAKLAVRLPAGTDETDAHVFVDTCDMRTAVQIVSVGLQPAAAAADCVRHDITGVFVVRKVTTFVVSLEGPSLHLAQGPAPEAWYLPAAEAAGPWSVPRGVVLFGGAGVTNYANAESAACGNVTSCSSDSVSRTVTAGAQLWISRFFGVQVTYARPAEQTNSGSGTGFTFSGTLNAQVVTFTGMLGVPLGHTRLYGLGGVNYHHATSEDTDTINDATALAGGVAQTIPGGTQTLEHKTEGWNWVAGVGFEAWFTKSFALYIEAQDARLKATDVGSTEGGIDDYIRFAVIGARVRLGR